MINRSFSTITSHYVMHGITKQRLVHSMSVMRSRENLHNCISEKQNPGVELHNFSVSFNAEFTRWENCGSLPKSDDISPLRTDSVSEKLAGRLSFIFRISWVCFSSRRLLKDFPDYINWKLWRSVLMDSFWLPNAKSSITADNLRVVCIRWLRRMGRKTSQTWSGAKRWKHKPGARLMAA